MLLCDVLFFYICPCNVHSHRQNAQKVLVLSWKRSDIDEVCSAPEAKLAHYSNLALSDALLMSLRPLHSGCLSRVFCPFKSFVCRLLHPPRPWKHHCCTLVSSDAIIYSGSLVLTGPLCLLLDLKRYCVFLYGCIFMCVGRQGRERKRAFTHRESGVGLWKYCAAF